MNSQHSVKKETILNPSIPATTLSKPFTAKGFMAFEDRAIMLAWRLASEEVQNKSPMNKMIPMTLFKEEVIESRKLSLVQFRTEWSGACQIILPLYEDLAKAYKGIVDFFSIDAEQERGLEKEFGVREFPTILFFKNGQLVDHAVGLTPKTMLVAKIENALT